MKRRTFISLAGLTAALWLPSIAKASQKVIPDKAAATSSPITPPLQPDAHEYELGTVIKVIGLGGAGGKAIEQMIGRVHGVEFLVADTDTRALKRSRAKTQIQLGQTGHGTRANPEAGFSAAMKNRQRLAKSMEGAHMVIIVAGMGGGTGMGAAPVFSEVARELGILTVGIVTMPFGFEGKRLTNAPTGIARLQPHIDSLILVPNDKLIGVLGDEASMDDAFNAVHDVIFKAISGITDIIVSQGLVGVDFEDVRTVLAGMGLGVVGIATATGIDRARVAAREAIASPLLEGVDLAGAQGLLITITAKRGLRMKDINEVMDVVREATAENAHVIFGTSYDENMADDLRVTLIATGYMGGYR